MNSFQRRHSRWYEVILLSTSFQMLAGVLVVAILPTVLLWGVHWQTFGSAKLNAILTAIVCFLVSLRILKRISRFSRSRVLAQIGPVATAVFFVAFFLLLFTRSTYARSVMLAAYALTLVWCYIGYFLGRRYRRLKLAVLPLPPAFRLHSTPQIEIRKLTKPDLEGTRYDGIVADLGGDIMTPEWERFLAECILAQIPVFHARQVIEGITGRVHIDHLTENAAGALVPSPLYAPFKRCCDIAGVLVTSPVTVPLMLVTALVIRLDSRGPALFRQQRVGLGNRDFVVCKFRSMRVDSERDGARFADNGDHRITRVGHFLRRSRLDELPQLWNVLKGDMSLIGPRPEQRAFADEFERKIPFYVYRHVVRPGITGWAQVMQGYVGSADKTRLKIQYDFYYIKHFSFWLDLLITLKTIRVVLTGWGAR